MTQAARLVELRDKYQEAVKANEAAFFESQAAFRAWENALIKYATTRRVLSQTAAALMNAEITAV